MDDEIERMRAQAEEYINGEDKGPRQRTIYDSTLQTLLTEMKNWMKEEDDGGCREKVPDYLH